MTATAYAGEVVEVISKGLTSSENAEETLKFLFSDVFMKMSTDQENDVIFNSQSRNMMIISHAEKSYMIFDENTASNIKSEIDKAMEEALAQVPPEQRAMVERMMKQQM
jgi:oligoendopeptidase F